MSKMLSINRKKVKRNTSINQLIKENNRDESTSSYYDDGHRMIDTSKTKDNVILVDFERDILRNDDFFSLIDAAHDSKMIDDNLSESIKKNAPRSIDAYRESFIGQVDDKRKNRTDLEDTSLLSGVELRKATQRNNSKMRATRKDTVDVITSVVQPSASFIHALSREQQIKFFRDCLDVMNDDPDTYGKTLNAVIHFDENTPHMQVISSTYNEEKKQFDAKEMLGNKTKMSNDQTKFVENVIARGWDVERGIKRINNVEYKNFKDEMKRHNIDVNRHNDKELFESYQQAERMRKEIEREREEFEREKEESLAEIEEQKRRISDQISRERDELSRERDKFYNEQAEIAERYVDAGVKRANELGNEILNKYKKERDPYRVVARDLLVDKDKTNQKLKQNVIRIKKENQQDEISQHVQDIAHHQMTMSKKSTQRSRGNEFQ